LAGHSRHNIKRESLESVLKRESVGRGLPHMLGVHLTSLTRKKVIAEMRVTPMHINRNGWIGGGSIMAFADVMAAMGTVLNLPPGHRTSTLESKTNFLAGGKGPVLKAVSIPLHIGRTTMVWQTTVSNPDGRTVAIVTQTQIVLPIQEDTAPTSQRPNLENSKRRRRRGAPAN